MADQWKYYLGADCSNCGRRRLEYRVEVDQGENREEYRLVEIKCEKCRMTWDLTPAAGEYRLDELPYDEDGPFSGRR